MKKLATLVLALLAFIAQPAEAKTARKERLQEVCLVPFLDKIGWPSDRDSRNEYADAYSIENYDGSVDKNTKLLDSIKATVAQESLDQETRLVPALDKMGWPSDRKSRNGYAPKYGIKGYKGTADQNTKLLEAIRADQAQDIVVEEAPAKVEEKVPEKPAPVKTAVADNTGEKGLDLNDLPHLAKAATTPQPAVKTETVKLATPAPTAPVPAVKIVKIETAPVAKATPTPKPSTQATTRVEKTPSELSTTAAETPKPRPQPDSKPSGKKKWPWIAGGLLVLATLFILFFALRREKGPNTKRPPTRDTSTSRKVEEPPQMSDEEKERLLKAQQARMRKAAIEEFQKTGSQEWFDRIMPSPSASERAQILAAVANSPSKPKVEEVLAAAA